MPLDLDLLLSEKKKIYVKNTSRPMGHIVLTFVTAHGKSVARNIPRTWIPICLTDTLSPEIIGQSNELRQFLNKGILSLLKPEDALKELGKDDAIEEFDRLNVSEFSNKAEATDKIIGMQNQYTPESDPLNPRLGVEGGQADPVNNRVKATLLLVEANDLTEREAVAELRIMKEELSGHDLTYIISQVAKEDGADATPSPLRRFAYQLLSEQQAAVDRDVVENEDPVAEEDPAAAAAGRAGQQV
jgi:hypothetical protein